VGGSSLAALQKFMPMIKVLKAVIFTQLKFNFPNGNEYLLGAIRIVITVTLILTLKPDPYLNLVIILTLLTLLSLLPNRTNPNQYNRPPVYCTPSDQHYRLASRTQYEN